MLTLVISYVLIIAGVALMVASFVFLQHLRAHNQIDANLDTVLLAVRVPYEEQEGQTKQPEEILAGVEQFYVGMVSLAKTKKTLTMPAGHITMEIAQHGQQTHFYISAPRAYATTTEKQLHAIFPSAIVEPVSDYTIFTETSVADAAELTLKSDAVFPLRTYKNIKNDPLDVITSSLSKMAEGEGAVLQILIRPDSGQTRKTAVKTASVMQVQGLDPKEALAEAKKGSSNKTGAAIAAGAGSVASSLAGEFMGQGQQNQPVQPPEKPMGMNPAQEELAGAIMAKGSKPSFETKIRVITSAATAESARASLEGILAAFNQYSWPDINEFTELKTNKKKLVNDFIFRNFSGRVGMILSSEELVGLFHPPLGVSQTVGVDRARAKKLGPPSNLPTEGVILGDAEYRGQSMPVRIKVEDRMRHVYTIGTTGSGKTTLLQNMATQDILEGRGVCVIDPHGGFIDDILTIVPPERAEDVILFDPGDTDMPMGLNMLEFNTPEQRDLVANEMIAIFHKLFPPEMIGPIFEHQMRNVMLTLMADPDDMGTMAEIPRMFTDEVYQKSRVAKVTDPVVKEFWEKEMAKTSDFHKSETLGYLVSKVGQFVENGLMRNIIGQQHSAFNLKQVMDEGKILLVNLSKGKIGDINSSLLGLIIVSKLQMAVLARAAMVEEDRRDFFLYIDEFQNFVTDSIAVILSEARKYRLSLNMAHQFIAQLSGQNEAVRDAVFGNVGTMAIYRVGASDAEYLGKEFSGVLSQSDLIGTERFHANVKLLIDGTVSRPFTMHARPFNKGQNANQTRLVRDLSRMKFGRQKTDVEQEIRSRAGIG